jgi:hypothetical protein
VWSTVKGKVAFVRVERGVISYRSAHELVSSGVLESYRGRDVAVRSAAGHVMGGLKVLVDDVVIARVDVTPPASDFEEAAAIWAYLAVHATDS